MKPKKTILYKGAIEGRVLYLDTLFSENEKHCCIQMKLMIEQKEKIIVYDAIKRCYGFRVSLDIMQIINFCPWCSKELPKQLRDKWFDILEKEYGMNTFDDLTTIPQEFKTSEWWKKRGL